MRTPTAIDARQLIGRRVGALLALLLATAGCQRQDHSATPAVEPVYHPDTGALTLLKQDADHNGVPDTVSHMEGPRILRIEVDQNQDGRIDRWEHYGPSQTLARVGFSRARDGHEDAWSYADASGRIVRVEIDTRRDGRISRTEHYEAGSLARAEEDSDGDERTDRWEEYAAGRLARVSFDTAHAGVPTHTLTYGADGSARVETVPTDAPTPPN